MPSPIVAEVASFEIGAQEPWPEDAQLFQPYEIEQILLPDNANCHAVQAYLKMCNLPFWVEMRWNAEWMSPSGRVPFLKCGQFLVAELEGVVQLCSDRGAKALPDLTPAERADLRAYSSAIHNVMFNAELYLYWVEPSTYNEVTSKRYGSVFPWPLNVLQTQSKRRQVVKKLKVFGWYYKTLDEVLQEVDRCLQALKIRLGNQDYFFGKKPCELDALVFGHIFGIVTTNLPCQKLAQLVQQYPELIALAQRIENNYFKKKP